ncbi:MAG: hypothetical protein IKP61_02310 [Spirochaetales bacterium]|nr:hypothetical protein [Spirochaetales bacterium]
MNVVFFTIFAIVGVIAIFNLTVGKKNREKASQHNKDVFGTLRDKVSDTFGNSRAEQMKKIPYMSDNGNGYVLCFSEQANIMALVTFSEVYTMKYNTKKSCEIIMDGDAKAFNSLVCRISAEELEQDVEVVLATSRHRKGSFVGKAILQDAEELKAYITGEK